MTCIVAMKHNGTIYMAGDSLQLSGLDIEFGKKVFRVGELLVGQSGWLRFGQLMEFSLVVPEREENEKNDMSYIVSKLIPAIRQCAKDNGYAKVENSAESVDDMLLVGYRGNIYKVFSDFSVQCISRKFAAIGCGADYALGALAAIGETGGFDDFPSAALTGALRISATFNAGVNAPFYIETM